VPAAALLAAVPGWPNAPTLGILSPPIHSWWIAMKSRAFLIFLILGGAVAVSRSAGALTEGIGKGDARACYLAAETHQYPEIGIATCSRALVEESLNNADRASTLVNRGVLKFANGENAEAMADFEAAIKILPEQGDAYADRGVSLILLGRYDEALANINQGIDLGLNHPYLGYYDRALAEEVMGRYPDAYRDYKHALELEPGFTQASDKLKTFILTKAPSPS